MGILDRFTSIVKANINELLDKAEDPEKMVDQYLREMTESLAEVREATAGVMAEEKRCKKLLDENREETEKYEELARKALAAGNEADARVFLAKKQELAGRAEGLTVAYEGAKANADKMRQMHDKLVADIEELNARKATIKAKAAVAKTQSKVNEMTSASDRAEGARSAFDRMEAKADEMLDRANAVAELVVGALIAGSRNLVDAVNWAQTLKGRDTIAKDVEKGKKAFVGPELRGKTLGVIGLGAIGARVANAAVALGMEVLGYDPYISIDAAWSLSRSVQHCVTLGDMLPRCDYLTIHVPYLPTTRHTINAQTLAMCKDGVRVLNFARGELVDNAALLDALNSGKVAQYFCDFPTEELLGVKGVCCTPHLGASTPESETNCAVMAAAELSDYLKNGNISHSVNLPDVSQPRVGGRRICIIHKNAPGAISAITSILTEAHLNIENMVNKGKKDVAYTLLDVTGNVTDDLAVKLGAIEPAIRVRVL